MKPKIVSLITFGVLAFIAVVVIALFFFVTGDNNVTEVAADGTQQLFEPKFTDLLIYTMYAFTGILTILTVVNLILAVSVFRDGGLIRVLAFCGGSVVLYLIFRYAVCANQDITEIPESVTHTAQDMALADAYIWTIGILFVIAIIVWLISASGVLARTAIKGK